MFNKNHKKILFSEETDKTEKNIVNSFTVDYNNSSALRAFSGDKEDFISSSPLDLKPWAERYYENSEYSDVVFLVVLVPRSYHDNTENYENIIYDKFKEKYKLLLSHQELKEELKILELRTSYKDFVNFKVLVFGGYVKRLWNRSQYKFDDYKEFLSLFLQENIIEKKAEDDKQLNSSLTIDKTLILPNEKLSNDNFLLYQQNKLDVKRILQERVDAKKFEAERFVRNFIDSSSYTSDLFLDGLNTLISRFDLKRLAAIAFSELSSYLDERDGQLECDFSDLKNLIFCPQLGNNIYVSRKLKIPNTNIHVLTIPRIFQNISYVYNNYKQVGQLMIDQFTTIIVQMFSATFDVLFKYLDVDVLNKFIVPCNTSAAQRQNTFTDSKLDTQDLFRDRMGEIEKLLKDYELEIEVSEFLKMISQFLINFNINQLKSILNDKYDASIFFVIKSIIELIFGEYALQNERYTKLLEIMRILIDSSLLNTEQQVLDNCSHYDPYVDLSNRLAELSFKPQEIQNILDLKKKSSRDTIKALCMIINKKDISNNFTIPGSENITNISISLVDNIFDPLSIEKYATLNEFFKSNYFIYTGNVVISSLFYYNFRFDTAFSSAEKLNITNKIRDFDTNLISSNSELQFIFEGDTVNSNNFTLNHINGNISVNYKGEQYEFSDLFRRNLIDNIDNSNLSVSFKENLKSNLNYELFYNNFEDNEIKDFFYEEYYSNTKLENTRKFKILNDIGYFIGLENIKSNVKMEIK